MKNILKGLALTVVLSAVVVNLWLANSAKQSDYDLSFDNIEFQAEAECGIRVQGIKKLVKVVKKVWDWASNAFVAVTIYEEVTGKNGRWERIDIIELGNAPGNKYSYKLLYRCVQHEGDDDCDPDTQTEKSETIVSSTKLK